MTQGISGLDPFSKNVQIIPTTPIFNTKIVQNSNSNLEILNAMNTPQDIYIESNNSIAQRQAFFSSIMQPEFETFQDRLNAFYNLSEFPLESKILTLVNLTYDNLGKSTENAIGLMAMIYAESESYYRTLMLESFENNVHPLLQVIDELNIQEFQTSVFFEGLVEDSYSTNPQISQLAQSVLEKIVENKQFSNVVKSQLIQAQQAIVFRKSRSDGADAKMWYNLMPELEMPKEAISMRDQAIKDIDKAEETLAVNQFRIDGRSSHFVEPRGIAIVLHASASMSKFHAEMSGLDIFRFPLTITQHDAEAFIFQLLKRGFHDVILLMPDSDVWPDYHAFKAIEGPSVHIIDTKTAGLGLGMLLNEIITYLSEHKSDSMISKNWIETLTEQLRHWIIVFNHHRIQYKDWLKHYAYEERTHDHNLCLMANDARPNEGTWVLNLETAFDTIKNEIEERITSSENCASRIVIVHESPFHDEVVSFAYELRKISSKIPILVRHHAPRQKPFFGRHISIAIL